MKKGFTLVEIMIVVAILALLLGVAVPGMLRVRINANETSAQATLKSFGTACESYAAANAAMYPSSINDLFNTNPPYFSYNISIGTKDGYSFNVVFVNNGYTVTATALPNAGSWDYQVTTGLVLKRSVPGQGAWQDF